MSDLEERLRVDLAAFADAGTRGAGLAPAPLLKTHRRGTVLRRTAAGASLVVALTGLAVATDLPGRGRADRSPTPAAPPQRPVAVAHGPAGRPLDIGRVRGSLAQDAKFLAALRTRVLTSKLTGPSDRPLELTSRDVTVYYAGDYAGERRALVQVAGRAAAAKGLYTIWMAGSPDQGAGGLRQIAAGLAGSRSTEVLGVQGDDEVLVVVNSDAVPVLIASAPTLAADGTVERSVRRIYPSADGLIETLLRPGELWRTSAPGEKTPMAWTPARGFPVELPPDAVDRALPFVHAGAAFPGGKGYAPRDLADALGQAHTASGLPVDAPRRYLWSGSHDDTTSSHAVLITAPSGAHVLFVRDIAPDPRWNAYGSGGVSTVLPAGPPEQIAVAWERIEQRPTASNSDRPLVVSVGVIGPVGAARVRMTDRTGHVLEAALRNGGGFIGLRTPDTQGTTVDFLDADGSVLATTKVLPVNASIGSGFTER